METNRLREVLGSRYEECNSEGHKNPDYGSGKCGNCYRDLKPSYWYLIENNPELVKEQIDNQRELDWNRGLELLANELGLDESTSSNSLQVSA